MHSQAILRIVEPSKGFVTEDDFIEAEVSEETYVESVADGDISSISDDRRRAIAREAESDPDTKDKPAS